MSRRKHSDYQDKSGKGFTKWISGIMRRVKPHKRHTLSEGTRRMTPEEELAAIEAAWSPRERDLEQGIPVPETVDNPTGADPAPLRERDVVKDEPVPETVYNLSADDPIQLFAASEMTPASKTKLNRKHKPKRRLRLFGRRRNKETVPIELALLTPLKAEDASIARKTYRVYIKPTINSTALFVLAYYIVWLTYQLAVMVQASFSSIDSVLYYYEVMFPIGNYSTLWSQFNIILITAAGPFISVLMGVVYFYVFLGRRSPGSQVRLLLVWLYLLSMAFFFGAFVAGAITHQGFGYVESWLYLHIAFRIGISLIFLFFLGFLGWKTIMLLPEVSGPDSYNRSRVAFVLSRLTIPWLVGGTLMLLLKYTSFVPQHPNIFDYDTIIIASMIFPVVSVIFNRRDHPFLAKNSRRSTSTKTIVLWGIAALILTFLVRVGLRHGLHFVFRIFLEITKYR